MARDLPGTRQAVPQLRPGFSLQTSQLPQRPREKPPAVAKASPLFALDPALLASRHGLRNTATPPRLAPPPARTFQSIVRGIRRADTLPRPIEVSRQRASPSPAVPAIPLAKFAPSIILHHRRHQPRRKVLRHAVQRGVLLFKKVLDAVWILR